MKFAEVVTPLCRAEELILEKSMSVLSTAKTDVTGLKVADIGLGTVKIWHGTPDARVRGSHLVFQKVENGESEGSDAELSDGATTPLEANKNFIIIFFHK